MNNKDPRLFEKVGDLWPRNFHNSFRIAYRYRGFCKKYRPQAKPEKRNHWGSRFLPSMKNKGKGKKSPGQLSLPWDKQGVTESTEVQEVAEKFINANGFNPAVPGNEFMKC